MWSLGYVQVVDSAEATSNLFVSEKPVSDPVAESSANAHFFANHKFDMGCENSDDKNKLTSPTKDGEISEASECTPKLDRTISELDDDFVFIESNQFKENNQRSVLQSGIILRIS